MLDPDDVTKPGKYRREHVVGLDGKVFSSPLRTLDRERIDKITGELRPVRQDTARQRYGEGGVDNLVWGTKFAIASVRSRLANHRVILGLAHFDATTAGGEGRVFTDLALDLARRTSGIHAYTADGAWRGTHLNQIQTATGCGVIAPPRRRTGKRGGSSTPTARPSTESSRVTRPSATPPHRDGTVRHQFYGRYSLPCPGHSEHEWWEPLLNTAEDAKAKFNRTEYLRITPTTGLDTGHRLFGSATTRTRSTDATCPKATPPTPRSFGSPASASARRSRQGGAPHRTNDLMGT